MTAHHLQSITVNGRWVCACGVRTAPSVRVVRGHAVPGLRRVLRRVVRLRRGRRMTHVHKRLHAHHGWWRPECSCGWLGPLLVDKQAARVAWRLHRARAEERVA